MQCGLMMRILSVCLQRTLQRGLSAIAEHLVLYYKSFPRLIIAQFRALSRTSLTVLWVGLRVMEMRQKEKKKGVVKVENLRR